MIRARSGNAGLMHRRQVQHRTSNPRCWHTVLDRAMCGERPVAENMLGYQRRASALGHNFSLFEQQTDWLIRLFKPAIKGSIP